MIPESVHDLPSMVAILAARGDPVEELYQCPTCKRCAADLKCTDCLPLKLEEDGSLTKLHRFVCDTCASAPHRLALAEQAAELAEQIAPWDTDLGKQVKIKRDQLINATLWTDAPGSPLTQDCQQAFTDWRKLMHRLTLDFADPGEAIIPDQPDLEYGD
jgi:hypothetical protein